MKSKILPVLALSILAAAGSAKAVPIKFSIEGVVNFADPGNAFGLAVGDIVTTSAIFDDSLLTGVGFETIELGLGSGNSMRHQIGGITLTESMDVDFEVGFPLLNFLDGFFEGWDVITEAGVNGAPASYDAGFFGFDAVLSDLGVEGTWNFDTARFSAVPEPSTLLLVALGLLTLGLRRRRA